MNDRSFRRVAAGAMAYTSVFSDEALRLMRFSPLHKDFSYTE